MSQFKSCQAEEIPLTQERISFLFYSGLEGLDEAHPHKRSNLLDPFTDLNIKVIQKTPSQKHGESCLMKNLGTFGSVILRH